MLCRIIVMFGVILTASCIKSGSTLPRHKDERYRRFIDVSEHGNDSTCLASSSLEVAILHPCKTLDHAINFTTSATQVILEPGVHNLTRNATFEKIFNLRFSGNGSRPEVEIHCFPDVGFTFIRSGNIDVQGITFTRCGSLHFSTVGSMFRLLHKEHVPFYAGLFFAYSKNVTIEDCEITKSPGIGMALYDVGGEVNVIQSVFSRNSPDLDNICPRKLNYTKAGGGLYVEFTFEGALPPFNATDPERFAYQNNNTYLLEGCTFEENFAPEQCFMNNIEYPSGNDHMPFGRGGGLSFFVKGNASKNFMTIRNCTFRANYAIWGAGMFVEIQDATEHNTMTILQSFFEDNKSSTGGGGLRTGIPVWKGRFHANEIISEDCIYQNNSAIRGGGVSHYSPFYHPVNDRDNYRRIIFRRCVWVNNGATLGSALALIKSADMTASVDSMSPIPRGKLLPYVAFIEDCNFTSNHIIQTEDNIVIGQGALYSFKYPLILNGSTVFEKNSDTALLLDNAILKVFGNTTFTNNSGLQGGGIAMYGESLINLMPASEMYFKKNQAKERGGAMFVNVGGPPVVAFETTELNTRACFLAYNDTVTVPNVTEWHTKITFDSNLAAVGGGNSVYATSLQSCRGTADKRMNNKSFEWSFIEYVRENGSHNISEEVSTDPISIQVIKGEWYVSPGERFKATINLIDEKNSLVQGVVKVSLDAETDAALGIPSPLLLINDIDQPEKKVPGLVIKGSCGSTFNLNLRTVSGQTISTTETNIRLLKCRQGFLMGNNDECECSKDIYIGLSRCSEDKKSVFLTTGYWGGDVGGMFVTYPCPRGHCYVDRKNLTRDFKLDETKLCAKNRDYNTTLCGECRKGYTVLLGNEECVETGKKCNKERIWLLPVFFLLMPLIFVLLLLKIKLEIFTTYLNVWLYSYQIIGYLVRENQHLDTFISFVIDLAKWKIHGLGVCILPGLTNFYKLGIHYFLPAYVLLLLFVLSKIARLYPRCYINKNVSHALCNLLVFCYTDITIITFNTLHYVPVGGKWVLYSDGNIEFYDDWSKHLVFTILAILLLVFFVTLLPLMLLFTPFFFNKFPFLNNFRLFFDLFQSCFEDQDKQRNNRWFAAFYFICRIWILVVALYVPFGPVRRAILEASCILILGICLYLQPYNTKYKWLNTLDAVLLTNLCLITVFSTALTSDANILTYDGALLSVVNILAYIPLIYVVALVLFYGWRYLREAYQEQRSRLIPDTDTDPTEEPESISGDSAGQENGRSYLL